MVLVVSMKLFAAVTLCILLPLVYTQTNYCSSSLCSGSKHIACNNNGKFGSSCPSNARLIDISAQINRIVDYHNTKRNQIAAGQLSGYKSAKRMATMQWDSELSSLAALNVKQCVMSHDACHNTNSFKYSGQNLAYMGYSGAESSNSDASLMPKLLDMWWNEYKVCKMDYINKYPSGYSGPAIGHFTVMVADINIRVGCAAARYYDGKFNNILMACNYATTNIIGRTMYESGTAASGCKTGKNSKYSSLCSTKETYVGLK